MVVKLHNPLENSGLLNLGVAAAYLIGWVSVIGIIFGSFYLANSFISETPEDPIDLMIAMVHRLRAIYVVSGSFSLLLLSTITITVVRIYVLASSIEQRLQRDR